MQLSGGTCGVCTDWLVVLLRTYSYTSLLVSLVGRTIYFGCQLHPVVSPLVPAVCPPARRTYVCAVSQPTPRKTRSVMGSREHFGKATK